MKLSDNKWKISAAFVFLISFALALGYFSKNNQAPKTIKFFAAHGPVEVITQPLQAFKEEVEKKTEGRVRVEVIITQESQDYNLKTEREVMKLIESNEYQMSQIYTKSLIPFAKDFAALEVPFIFKDHAHSFATVDGEVGRDLLAKLENNSFMKGLGYTYCGGYRFISTKSKKITKLSDFEGLKLATGTPVSTKILAKLGVIPAKNLEKIQIRKLVESEQLDGMVTVYPRYFHNGEYKISTIANEIFFNIQFTVLAMNKDFFNSLEQKDQQIVEQAAHKISLMERKIAMDIADDVGQNASTYGVTISKLEPAENKKLIDKLLQVDWTQELNLTPGLVERIKDLTPVKVSNL